MIMDTSVRPPSLGEYLDAGGDPRNLGVDVWQLFHAELLDALLVDPAERQVRWQDAAEYRQAAEDVADGRLPLPEIDAESGRRWESAAQFALITSWRADLA